MVVIIDFCWSAFLTKSALFLKLAPPGKKTPAPLVRWLSRGRVLQRVFQLQEQIAFFLRQQNFGVLAEKFSQEEFIAKIAYLADIFDSLNSLNLSMQGVGFTVIEKAAKVAAYHKKLAW